MNPPRAPAWAVSLADLALLLLAFFVFIQASEPAELAASARAAFPDSPAPSALFDGAAAPLFERGEARLKPEGQRRLQRLGASAAALGTAVRIESRGRDQGASRFDAWELASARAAAAARALQAGGLPGSRIDIVLTASSDEEGQRLTIRSAP